MAPARRSTFITRQFVLAASANLILSVAGSFAIHLSGFLQQLGAGEAEIGRIMSVQALAALLAGPFVGGLMDRSGRTAVIRAGCGLYLLAALMYLEIETLGAFVYLVRLVDGVSATLLYAALFTYAADVVPPERRTQGLAVFGASGLAPMAISGQLGDLILRFFDYRVIFIAALGFGLLGTLLCLPLRDVATGHVESAPAARGMRATLRQPDLRPLWPAAFGFFFALSAVLTFAKTFMLRGDHGNVGNFFTVYAAVAIGLRLFAGWLPDRIGLPRMVVLALLSFGIGSAVLGSADRSLEVLLAGALCGVGHGFGYPVLYSLVVARASVSDRGTAMAIYTTVDWAGMLASGPVLGLVIERAGYAIAFWALGALLFAAAALFHVSDSSQANKAPESPSQRA